MLFFFSFFYFVHLVDAFIGLLPLRAISLQHCFSVSQLLCYFWFCFTVSLLFHFLFHIFSFTALNHCYPFSVVTLQLFCSKLHFAELHKIVISQLCNSINNNFWKSQYQYQYICWVKKAKKSWWCEGHNWSCFPTYCHLKSSWK